MAKRDSGGSRAVGFVVLTLLVAMVAAGCGGRTREAVANPTVGPPASAEGVTPTAQGEEPAGPPAQPTPSQATAEPSAAPTPERMEPSRTAADGEVLVDAAALQGVVSPYANGATWGPLWPVAPDMMPLLQEVRIGMLSFPGGEYGDTTNLQTIEIDRFIDLCSALGAEPLIHVRLPGGTPEQAVGLINYSNQQKGYNVKYWAIGNEPNLYPGKYVDTPWDPAYFAAEWRRFAEAMKAADPSIVLVGPEVTQFAGTEGVTRSDELLAAEWIRTFLEVNGDLVDIVSIHRYPFPVDSRVQTTADELMANPPEWDERIIPDLRALMRETLGRELPIAVTEVNSHWSRAFRQEASPDSLLNAIWWGDVYMRMVREGLDLVTFWLLSSKDDQGGWGIVGRYGERPTYSTFALYARMGDQLLFADVGGGAGESVGALAALRDDGALTVMLSNRGTDAQELTLAVENAGAPFEPFEMWRIDADHLGTRVEGELPAPGRTFSLPARSLTLLVLR